MGHLADHLRLNPTTPLSDHSPPATQLQSPDHPHSTTKPNNDHEITFSNTQPTDISPSDRAKNLTSSFLRKGLHYMTELDPTDAWLPITQSRNGNAYYAAFHTLCAAIGIQALILPVAFTILGWVWGILILSLAFIWQLYTLSLLINLHESPQTGVRYSRYMQLANASFGERLAKILVLLPILNLSVGTCVSGIIIGTTTSKLFFEIVCSMTGCKPQTLTTIEWYLVFTCVAILVSQLPNLNSIAGISLVGAITAVGYCSIIWVLSVSEDRLPNVSYNPVKVGTKVTKAFDVLNALGIIAFAFRGHNLILEIQATMPTSQKHPSAVPMWKGIKISYTLIAMCLFPLAIGGYWAYGQLIPSTGMLTALFIFHTNDKSKSIQAITTIFLSLNALCSFQIYGMPTFDQMESIYVKMFKKPCSWWIRVIMRTMFGFTCFFMAVAFQFLAGLTGLVCGIALPVTLVYPCFMWLNIKKPKAYSPSWFLNWGLGVLGTMLTGLLIVSGVYVVIDDGIKVRFFKPL